MKSEYKIVIRKPGESMQIAERGENRDWLEHKAECLLLENPTWEVRVVKENYNVS